MQVQDLKIPGARALTPTRHEDLRGHFSEAFNRRTLEALGLPVDYVQDNDSFNRARGTIRGLHFQAPPHAQAKLVRVVAGAVMDVVLDMRVGSPTFGVWDIIELSADRGNQLFVPAGLAHGFCTLVPDTHVLYKVSEPWDPEAEGGVRWDDPYLGVAWPPMDRYVLSDKDRELPSFHEITSPFLYRESETAAEAPR